MSEFTPAGLDAVLRETEAAAREAGGVLLEHFGRIDRQAVGHKSAARDLVTQADVEAERALVARLRRAFPGHAIEAEEEVHDAADAGRPRWFLDPLDGTVNFVHGIPAWCVSVALYVDAEPLVGVVHVPRFGETFVARRGGGARVVEEFRGGDSGGGGVRGGGLHGGGLRVGESGGGGQSRGGDGSRAERRLRVSECSALGDAVLATGFPYRRNELAHNNVANFDRLILEIRGIRRFGSAAMDLAWVAAGRLDGFWELHLAPHDVAAGALLVREAGGTVRDAHGGEDWLRGKSVVASGPGIFEDLRKRVRA